MAPPDATSPVQPKTLTTPGAIKTPPLLEFDQDGDLTLKVGQNPPQTMKVDSRALCRSSPVFRRMLRGSFSESQPHSGPWEVKLPGDSPHAMSIIMDMVHCQHSRTPSEISLGSLVSVLAFTNKYDMARLLRPVAWRWLTSVTRGTSDAYQGGKAYMLLIC